MVLVTQNIDDYHNKLIKKSQLLSKTHVEVVEGAISQPIVQNIAFTPHIYEIHGNVYYMHCSDET
jgi:NAD-dependent SIR2 family protein deacetylase